MVFDEAMTEHDCRRIAAALETASSHPLARAFALDAALPEVSSHKVEIGQGVSGVIDGRHWRLGSAAFVGGGAASQAQHGDDVMTQCVPWRR